MTHEWGKAADEMRDFLAAKGDVLSACCRLNFSAIAEILENYGYDDPERTIAKLRNLNEDVRRYQNGLQGEVGR